MGKAAKGSRKGKKAWRANISTEDIDDYFEKSTKDALTGHAATIASLPSDSLFYLDTKSNAVSSHIRCSLNENEYFKTLSAIVFGGYSYIENFVAATEIPAKRKIEKHKEKILHYESLLQKNPFVQAIPSSTLKKLKRERKKVNTEKPQAQKDPKVCN
ncbi:hypothetical protein B296_00041192 [Ensete ventricosum]|uniref:Ribosome biogenesis protein NOP53 n=1 Tax=Ensete ventricosum TaxID=4639 RepID=A0A426ZMV2_ENSVE|nr:hypothetical protein B296_00041192 [Ensete ventricosum]